MPPCQKYNVSAKIAFSNGTSSIYWRGETKTTPVLDQDFNLENFQLILNAKNEGKGEAFVKWNHTQGCVDQYAIRLKSETKQGEIMLDSAEYLQEMRLDLHSLPGMLSLENCQDYELWIYPETFPNLLENTV